MALKNDLLLRALAGEELKRPPVWMMRQAGRYLPDYMALKAKYSFFERCQNPELASEITIQPVDQVGVDAAILFSDILVVPQAMGMEVQMHEGKGPLLPEPIKKMSDLQRLSVNDPNISLEYVMKAIQVTKQKLNERVPLIGFAGAPWTLLCYMVQGKGTKTFDEAKSFLYTEKETSHKLLSMITEMTIAYLKAQIHAGVNTVQLFDSWAGILSPSDFREYSLPYIRQIVREVKDIAPVIVFAKGAWFALKELSETGASGLGIDWCVDASFAREHAGKDITLQGNFDPAKLNAPIPVIKSSVREMIKSFGTKRYIANLGHGILPNIPVDHAKAFVEAVKEFSN